MLPALSQHWAARHAAALAQMQQAGYSSDHVGSLAKIVRLSLQAGVMALGAVLILSTQASPGALMGANLLLGKVLGPFDALVSTWRRWITAGAAWRRLRATLWNAPVLDAATNTGDEPGLLLQGIRVTDPATGRVLLDDITLTIAPGTAVALVGPNGAGKSTLLRLLVGLARPTQGMARLHGMPMAAAPIGSFGYLPQGVQLLDGTVWENIARFTDAPANDVIAAASVAGVHSIVGRLRQGYSTRIGASSNSLSGGQKQRIGLARALFGAPHLIGLDEPDASLDGHGEAALLEAIRAACSEGTIVAVATHRPKLLAAMDLIVTVEAGRIASVQPTRAERPTAALPQPALA